MATIIDAAALKDRMDAGKRTVLLDVRWVLGDPHGHSHFRQAHIPGAVYVDLHHELADPTAEGQGRHPLPSTAALQRSARAWGINDGDTVVAYDDSGSTAAARLWWLLRDAGFHSVFLLDGGLGAWRAAGHPLAQDEQPPVPGDVVLGHGHMDAISMEDAADWHSRGILLDARAGSATGAKSNPLIPARDTFPAR
ncbi:putative thiosulfate sulfurtransferase SseB [Arthrobacter sp. Hiyo8]|nr:putative thiosulfate sulfurtransferase SseB [Arthrobacter sp. Hiyo8]